MGDLRTRFETDATVYTLRLDQQHWEGHQVEIYAKGPIQRVTINQLTDLRDWLNEVIESAGPRPLHPLANLLESQFTDDENRRNHLRQISNRLYRLDDLEKGK